MPFFKGALDTLFSTMRILDANLSSISICPRISGVMEYREYLMRAKRPPGEFTFVGLTLRSVWKQYLFIMKVPHHSSCGVKTAIQLKQQPYPCLDLFVRIENSVALAVVYIPYG